MPFRFKLGEGFEKGLRRIGGEQIERAIAELAKAETGAAVHETRKCIKRVRGLLRLVRDGIGNATFKRENTRFGDIGRMLSESRDRTVILATIARLTAEHPGHAAGLRALKKTVADPANGNSAEARRLAAAARRELQKAAKDWRALELQNGGLTPLEHGLSRGLADLRAALDAAEKGDDETVHDWRKAVQRHWRHMLLLREAWPLYFEARAAEAKEVSELLGDAQDLTLLVAHAERERSGKFGDENATAVVRLATERRAALRQAARERCLRLAAEGPDGHAERACRYWRAAEGLADMGEKQAREQIAITGKRVSREAAPQETIAAARDGLPRAKVKSKGLAATAAGAKRKAARGGRTGPRRRKQP